MWRGFGPGFQPLHSLLPADLGLRPRLVYGGPLALAFGEVAEGGGELREAEQGGHGRGPGEGGAAEGVGEHTQVEARRLDAVAGMALAAAAQPELPGASSVAIVLRPEGPEIERLAMVDDCGCEEVHLCALQPAGAEVAVFGSGEGEGCVEPAELKEGGARKGEVVGAEEAKALGNGMGVAVVEGDQDLAGGAEDAVFGGVVNSASESRGGSVREGVVEGAEPMGVGGAVVVGEDDVFAERLLQGRIARTRRAVAGLTEATQSKVRGVARDDRVGRRVAAVVHDEDFEGGARIVQRGERCEAAIEQLGAIAGGDYHGEAYWGGEVCGWPGLHTASSSPACSALWAIVPQEAGYSSC
jgi:hypothetical protein